MRLCGELRGTALELGGGCRMSKRNPEGQAAICPLGLLAGAGVIVP